MARKRICVLIAQPEENTQNNFMQGFLEKAYEYDYDVCTFSMYIKYQDSPCREVGDSNIYNLINFSLFDAVVMCEDTLQTPHLAEKLQRRIASEFAGGVVLVVDKENNLFPSVMMDHYTPIVKLVDHLIEHHGYKNIYFLSGRKGHIHSTQRLAGYMDSMKAHGLTVTDNMIYYGTYWYDSGERMVDELMKDREHLPEAIVCANDYMAIGVCTAFDKYGVKVPDDIAVVGYDSVAEGKNSPVPLTSADIPAKACGRYSAEYIHAKLTGQEAPEFKTEANLFMGGTCGCEEWKSRSEHSRRSEWQTDLSSVGYYSCFNNMMDDMIAQTDVEPFFNTVFSYVHQIRPFASFHLCLNDYWDKPEVMTGDKALRYGYTGNIYRIIKCGPDEESSKLSYNDVFRSDMLLPDLYEERDYPTVFMFTPLFFQDRSFGYAAVSYGREPRVYEEVYRLWLKTVCRDLEAFERYMTLTALINKIEAAQIRDGLTGLYNYRGFMSLVPKFTEQANSAGKEILATAIDLKNMRRVNSFYGHEEGDRLLAYAARAINELLVQGDLAMRMGNDEFVILSAVRPNDASRGEAIAKGMEEKFACLMRERDSACEIGVYCASKGGAAATAEELESLVNMAINAKNRVKAQAKSALLARKPVTEEELRQDEIVENILDENLLAYHFQPIVSAKDGSIFAYEALMRTKGPAAISPPALLASAARLGRLNDVERYTLFNVVDIVERHGELFRGKKVFINSMPGHMLTSEGWELFVDKVAKLECRGVVIEFTEEAELSDEELTKLKAFLTAHGIEIAIDDYGAGYSNVNNLLRYMPQYVKIDRMLLTGIDTDPHRQHFVRDIIEFTRDNGIMALAEGVETSEELKAVIQLGADLIQGYYTARPNANIIQHIPPKTANEIARYNNAAMN